MSPASIDFFCLISSPFAKNLCKSKSVCGYIEIQFCISNILLYFEFYQL